MNRFCPYQTKLGHNFCLRTTSGAVVKGMHAETHDPSVHSRDVCTTNSRVCQTLKYPKNYTPDWNQLSLLFPTSTNQYVGSFLCLDMEAVLTLALLKPQCTKSTMPNMYNSCKNSTSPYWPPQDENE